MPKTGTHTPKFDRTVFYNKLKTQMKNLTKMDISASAVELLAEYLFLDIESKIAYAEQQAERKGRKTISDEHISDVFCFKWPVPDPKKQAVVVPATLWDDFTDDERKTLVKMFKMREWDIHKDK